MRVHVTLQESLVNELDRRVGTRRRGSFITRAVAQALEDERRWELIEAPRSAPGRWDVRRRTMQSYRTTVSRLSHPVNIALHTNATLGVRVANAVTGFLGSWRFIVIQTIVVALWVAGNVYLVFHFDPYPFIFLNLAFSTQAAYAAPLILLASNQSAVRDRATLEHAALEAEAADRKDDDLRARLVRIEAMLTTLTATKD